MSLIVETARSWIGVPYLHQGRNRFGVDCAGLPWCVYAENDVVLPDFRAYGTEADPETFIAHLRFALGQEVVTGPIHYQDLQIGDIALFKFHFRQAARHVGIVSNRAGGGLNYIEANGNEGKVVERRLDDRRLVLMTHAFRRPL